jgi:hypothetical protein
MSGHSAREVGLTNKKIYQQIYQDLILFKVVCFCFERALISSRAKQVPYLQEMK